jgi:hypothetical protein
MERERENSDPAIYSKYLFDHYYALICALIPRPVPPHERTSCYRLPLDVQAFYMYSASKPIKYVMELTVYLKVDGYPAMVPFSHRGTL